MRSFPTIVYGTLHLDICVGLTIPVSSGSNLLCFMWWWCRLDATTTNNEIKIRQRSTVPACCELGVAFDTRRPFGVEVGLGCSCIDGRATGLGGDRVASGISTSPTPPQKRPTLSCADIARGYSDRISGGKTLPPSSKVGIMLREREGGCEEGTLQTARWLLAPRSRA